VDLGRIDPFDEVNVVSLPAEEARDPFVARAPEDGRPGDLVAVEVEHGENGAVARRIQVADALPRPFEGPRLGLAVTDDRDRDEVRVVHDRAERMREDVAELAPFVNRAWGGRAHMARHAAWGRELAKELAHPGETERHARVDLRVRPFEVDVREHRRPAMAWPCEEDDVRAVPANDAVQVRVDEVQPGRRPPVAEQTRLDVVAREWLVQERVVAEVDLADREVVGGAPVRIDEAELFGS